MPILRQTSVWELSCLQLVNMLDISADVSLKSSALLQAKGTLAYPLGVEYSFINRLVFLELAIFDEYEFKFVLLFIFQAKIIIGQ
jgi:hypothetical protein